MQVYSNLEEDPDPWKLNAYEHSEKIAYKKFNFLRARSEQIFLSFPKFLWRLLTKQIAFTNKLKIDGVCRVADPGCLYRIPILIHPQPQISDPGSNNHKKRSGKQIWSLTPIRIQEDKNVVWRQHFNAGPDPRFYFDDDLVRILKVN